MGEPQFSKYPNLSLSQDIFTLSNTYATDAAQKNALESLQNAIKQQKMAPLYRHLAHPTEGVLNPSGEGSSQAPGAPLKRQSSGANSLLAPKPSSRHADLPWDEKLYEELKADNEKELETIQKEEDEAIEKEGDTEVSAARAKRAEFWARVCDKVRSYHSLCRPIALARRPSRPFILTIDHRTKLSPL